MTDAPAFATADGKPWPSEGAPFTDPIGPEDFEPWAVRLRLKRWPHRCGERYEPRERF